MQYFLILGKNPELSRLEIESIKEKDWQISSCSRNSCLLLSTKTSAPPLNFSQKLIDRLGGTIKIGEILGKYRLSELKNPKIYLPFFAELKQTGKINFGISLYCAKIKIFSKTIGLAIKKELGRKKIKSRFVVSRQPELSSVSLVFNKLLTAYGIEFVVLEKDNDYFLGRTLTAQDFKAYSQKDYGRPKRDDRSGMLPPKLAKIMVNLSQAQKDNLILDPFCGSGTILTESWLLGYKNLLGSDISSKAVQDSRENLKYIAGSEAKNVQRLVRIFQADVCSLSAKMPACFIDCIITEPYLGPPLLKQATIRQIKKMMNELGALYLKSFQEFKKILKANGRIIIVFPVFILSQKKYYLSRLINGSIKKLGFKLLPIFAENEPVLYFREKQKIWREIRGYSIAD